MKKSEIDRIGLCIKRTAIICTLLMSCGFVGCIDQTALQIIEEAAAEEDPMVGLSLREKQIVNDGQEIINSSNVDLSRCFFTISMMRAGYTEEEANFAIEHCDMDWNEGALNMYLSSASSSTHSKEEARVFMESWEYTEEEIEYVYEHCGVDWKENAVRRLKKIINTSISYDELSYFSNKEIVERLKECKFTEEEISYAVECCDAELKENALVYSYDIIAGDLNPENFTAPYLKINPDKMIEMMEEEGFTPEQIAYVMEIRKPAE